MDKKFPVNQATTAGLIVNMVDNSEKSNRISFSIKHSYGRDKENKPLVRFINCLVTGKEACESFKKNYQEASQNLETKSVLAAVTGQAYFSKNKTENGVTNTNYSVISNDPKSIEIPKTTDEVSKFQKTLNSSVAEINQIQIRGTISSDITTKQNNNGRDFTSFSMVYNMVNKAENTTNPMYMNVVVPSNEVKQLMSGDFKKGTAIHLTGTPQPNSYVNKDGDKVYTAQIFAKNVALDNTKLVSVKKASESIMEVSKEENKEKRKDLATEKIADLKPNKKATSDNLEKTAPGKEKESVESKGKGTDKEKSSAKSKSKETDKGISM